VPDCNRIIDAGLENPALYVALRGRADAYHYAAQLGGAGPATAGPEPLEQALADLDRAAALGITGREHQDPPFWLGGPIDYARGEVLFQLGRFAAAAEAYGTVVAHTAGNFPAARFGRALALLELERGAEALTEMDALVASAPDSKAWLYHRGAMREGLGRTQDAIADYRSVLALDPDHGAALQGLIRMGATRTAN